MHVIDSPNLSEEVRDTIAKTFGEKADLQSVLIAEHPWTKTVYVFGEETGFRNDATKAFMINADGDVKDVGSVSVLEHYRYTSYNSLAGKFSISIDNDGTTPRYAALDGTPGPSMELIHAGKPGFELKQQELDL